MSYYKPRLELIEAWIPKFTENSNFYYDLTDLNRAHLAALIAPVANAPVAEVEAVFMSWIPMKRYAHTLLMARSNSGFRRIYGSAIVAASAGMR